DKSPRPLAAEQGLINSLYLKTTNGVQSNPEEVKNLIAKIQSFVDSNGVDYRTASSLYRLAELQIFYNNNVGAGVNILEDIIKTPRLRGSFMADSKLLLGDAYLMQNNIWDAKLMYGQVDKQFKEDAKGQEAKFKNAKLSYYTGDFEWAKSQLDILKTATTQLISNNAIELSLLIQDNTGLDSTEDAMIEYANAEFLLYQNKIDESSAILNMLPFKYPDHTLNDEIFYLKAKVQEKLGNYEAANKLYTTVFEKFGDDILADNALYRSANITLHILNDEEKAQELFEKLLLEYNSSLYAVDARKMYYGLKEGKSKKELFLDLQF
ncbi:MAG: tetratricopeptide repeat protein, partial [Bacteroidia bacterium]